MCGLGGVGVGWAPFQSASLLHCLIPEPGFPASFAPLSIVSVTSLRRTSSALDRNVPPRSSTSEHD